jgi:hypothetical protein
MRNVAHWWDVWRYIPSLLYGMNRYEDNLFGPKFREEVNRLIAKMLLFRRDLLKDNYSETIDYYQAEKVLLSKYRIYEEDTQKDADPSEVCEWLRSMTQAELQAELEKRETAKREQRRKYDQEQEERASKKVSPVLGDVGETVEDLITEVYDNLRKQEIHGFYGERLLVVRALYHSSGDVAATVELLARFRKKKCQHEQRYGYGKVKVCKRCELVVLDQRNKTGYCRDCLPRKRK